MHKSIQQYIKWLAPLSAAVLVAACNGDKAATSAPVSAPNITVTSTSTWQTMMGSAYAYTATITGGSSNVTPTVSGLTGNTVSPLSCALNSAVIGSKSCVFIVTPYTGSGNYSYWDTTNIANSDVTATVNAYTQPNINLTVIATNSATINSATSPQTFSNISGTVIAPYIYLAAPESGAATASNTGITWGTGGTVSTRFVVGKDLSNASCATGQEIESDTLTGLTWVKAPTSTTYTWATAKTTPAIPSTYCGYADWRLPTEKELLSLFNYAAVSGDQAAWLNNQGFTNVQPGSYWSATAGGIGAWLVGMSSGDSGSADVGNSLFVWPVRGGL